MVAELFQGRNLGPDGNVVAEDFHLVGFVFDGEAASAGSLESDEQYEIAWIGEALGQVVQDTPASGHAAGGNDDRGHVGFVDLLRLFGRGREGKVRPLQG